MVKRMVNIGKSVTEFRSPSQTSAYEWINIIIYVIEKQILWKWNDSLDEGNMYRC